MDLPGTVTVLALICIGRSSGMLFPARLVGNSEVADLRSNLQHKAAWRLLPSTPYASTHIDILHLSLFGFDVWLRAEPVSRF